VLAYFGSPRAHEDDAERAIRAGLELTGTVGRLQAGTGLRLAARIGIATGLAVVGDLIGEGAAREETVIGGMPNLAARLQTLAEPGEVVISQATRRLIGGLFELDDLGPQRLKGFAEPLAAWRVAGERHAEGRFEARQVAGLTPLVGREEELALLLRGWQRTKKGEGQVVLLSGEPGIGKSRLVRELHERLADGAHQRLLYQCSPYHQTSALHPVIEQLKRAAGLNRQDPGEARLNKLEALLARGTNRLTEAIPLVATLLSLATGHRYPPLDLSLQRQKERTLEVLVEDLEGLAAEQPVLVVYEDIHWIDPTTLELLDLAIERLQRTRVLLLITFRPEFQPSWSRHPRVTTLSLARLGRRDGALMVDRVVGAKVLPPDVTVQIVAKTDGVPLFVEELTKTVLESGLIEDAGDHYELAGPLPPLAIPATLHEPLLARLDRLAPVREVAQIGAALGREFSYELLAAVAPLDEPRLSDSLDQLVSSELVFRHGTPPEATYRFKHALVQDAAYGTLLKSRPQQLHARIAKVLEGQFPETARTQPELLAHHSMQAGLMEQAVEYWTKAGQLSLARSAMLEAVAQLMRGLEVLRSLPEGPERNRRELDLQVALGRALTATKGWAAPEVGSAYARGRELCLQEAGAPQFTQVLSGLFAYNLHCGRAKVAHEIAEDMLRLAERQQDPAAQVAGHRRWVAARCGAAS
jgi:predicted ATPase